MLKIDVIGEDGGVVAVKLHGRLVGPWVDELERACERIAASGASAVLDLGALSFADHRGVALLHALSGHGDACRAAGEYRATLRALKSKADAAAFGALRGENAGCVNLPRP